MTLRDREDDVETRDGRLANVGVAILIGGASTRMGTDKARLELQGEALATRLARLCEPLFEEILLVGGHPPPSSPGRAVPDAPGTGCALRGLVTALSEARSERVVVIATDMPLVTEDLLLALTAWPEHDAVVPRSDGRPQPLCALYRREPVLALARERLDAGDLKLRNLLDALDVGYIEGDDLAALDPHSEILCNVNTPEEFAHARERAVALAGEVREVSEVGERERGR